MKRSGLIFKVPVLLLGLCWPPLGQAELRAESATSLAPTKTSIKTPTQAPTLPPTLAKVHATVTPTAKSPKLMPKKRRTIVHGRINDMHPAIRLLDDEGLPVQNDCGKASAAKSCGACHDTRFIQKHSSHPTGTLVKDCLQCHLLAGEDDEIGSLGAASDDWMRAIIKKAQADAARALRQPEVPIAPVELPEASQAAIAVDESPWGTADGRLTLDLATPRNETCGRCHGLYTPKEDYLEVSEAFLRGEARGPYGTTLRTGEVFSGQPISGSFLNLAEKASLSRPWDIHLARGLGCTSCHFAANNPARAGLSKLTNDGAATKRVQRHLVRDPRTLPYHDYLRRPDHRLETAECIACHDPATTHAKLPYPERHIASLTCQACHVPWISAPAPSLIDRSVVSPEGGPRMEYRGVDTAEWPSPSTWFMTGYRPFLLLENRVEGERLAPFNVVASWEWIDARDGIDEDEAAPVSPRVVARAWKTEATHGESDGIYHEPLIALFDRNGDGVLQATELILDSEQRVEAIRARLIALGVQAPKLRARISAYPVRHNVVDGAWATGDCGSCHGEASRLDAIITLSSQASPLGPTPSLDAKAAAVLSGYALDDAGASEGLRLLPRGDTGPHYVLGHSRQPWSDLLGLLIFALTALGVAGHGGMRFLASRRAAKHADGATHEEEALERVYMYGTYERVWHWVMALSIVLLLITGFEIHYPGQVLGFMGKTSFATAVFIHNLMAVVLTLNASLSLFYHLTTDEIKQYIPERAGFIGRIIAQARYYLQGIFLHAAHPSEKTPKAKLNPLQQITYVGLLNGLFPFQILSGALLWVAGLWPTLLAPIGGMEWIGPAHNLGSWLFLTFLVVHVYLTTTGHTLTSNFKAMVSGWEDIPAEAHATETAEGAKR